VVAQKIDNLKQQWENSTEILGVPRSLSLLQKVHSFKSGFKLKEPGQVQAGRWAEELELRISSVPSAYL
jgi:hypothetical protein